jgi:hypothetical protein
MGSGTAWWQRALLAHPEISGPSGHSRGLNYFTQFCGRAMEDADVAGYHAHFPAGDGMVCGEWSGRYMQDAWTPPLLHRVAPESKLLVMLSDPIDRYRAVFADRVAQAPEGKRIYTPDVVERRRYAAQLERLHRFFAPDRVLVLQYERCRREPAAQYRRTLEFLGVRDVAFVPRPLRRDVGGSARARAVGTLMRLPGLRRVRGPVVERVTGRPTAERAAAALWPELEAALRTAFDPDVTALRRLVPELDLALWPNFAHLAQG